MVQNDVADQSAALVDARLPSQLQIYRGAPDAACKRRLGSFSRASGSCAVANAGGYDLAITFLNDVVRSCRRTLLVPRPLPDPVLACDHAVSDEIRGLLRTFGVLFGKTAGGFARRAQEIVAGDLDASPTMQLVIETLMQARAAILDRIKILERRVVAAARTNSTARLFMTAPGVGAITALSVISAFDKVSRFEKSSSAGAYLGLTPRRYESGEVSRNGHISKHGNGMTRKHLYEAATTLLTRTKSFSALKAWGLRLAKISGFKKARVAVARKLAVTLHAMWKTNTEFRWSKQVA